MLFLYVVVDHFAIKTPGGEPMFQKPPHEQEKAGRCFALVFGCFELWCGYEGQYPTGSVYVCYTDLYICQTNEPNLVKYTWILWVCWSKKATHLRSIDQ